MNSPVRQILVPLLIAFALAGCSQGRSGPASIAETSAVRTNLSDRVQFIEKYVTFRHKYTELEYDVLYQNNGGGMVPGPSDWDIRLIATVPSTDIDGWIPENVEKHDGSLPQWLHDLPGSIEKDGITEWYRKGGTEVGIDRKRSIVAYRNTSMPN